MNQLIPVAPRPVGSETIPTVNARELHAFLENKDLFANWIKDRIEQFGFVENQDFVTYLENPKKGRPRQEYALTLDMGKELSMVERNDKGKEARKYFIDCEHVAKAVPAIPSDPMSLLKLHYDAIVQTNQRVDEVQASVAEIVKTTRLHQWQCYELKAAVTQRAKEFHEKYGVAYPMLFPSIWNYVKRSFRVVTYSAIPAVKFNDALTLVKNMQFENMADYVQGLAGGGN
jgi:phage anti-repressor protein